MARLSIGLIALILASCSTGPGGNPRSQGPSSSRASSEATRRLPTPTIHIDRGPGKPMTLTGALGVADVEGGCAYLETAKGTRYEVLYPKGWKLNRGSGQLTNPQGEVVATAGDTLTVRGEIATNMASTCMIGPIFRADEVVSIER